MKPQSKLVPLSTLACQLLSLNQEGVVLVNELFNTDPRGSRLEKKPSKLE